LNRRQDAGDQGTDRKGPSGTRRPQQPGPIQRNSDSADLCPDREFEKLGHGLVAPGAALVDPGPLAALIWRYFIKGAAAQALVLACVNNMSMELVRNLPLLIGGRAALLQMHLAKMIKSNRKNLPDPAGDRRFTRSQRDPDVRWLVPIRRTISGASRRPGAVNNVQISLIARSPAIAFRDEPLWHILCPGVVTQFTRRASVAASIS
jgi:hypothetical protein